MTIALTTRLTGVIMKDRDSIVQAQNIGGQSSMWQFQRICRRDVLCHCVLLQTLLSPVPMVGNTEIVCISRQISCESQLISSLLIEA